MSVSYHCPHCHQQYGPFFSINWSTVALCDGCTRPFEVSPGAFHYNCGLVFATYSFVPGWILAAVWGCYRSPTNDLESLFGQILQGAIGGLIVASAFFLIGGGFGFLNQSQRRSPGS